MDQHVQHPLPEAAASPDAWPVSAGLYDRALQVMPGGNTRTQLYAAPFPVYAARAEGVAIELADGAVVTDFLLNYTSAAVGHANPAVVEAIVGSLSRVGPMGVPMAGEIELAEALRERVPAIRTVRFTNSGSEATLHALRAARAFTGRSLIAKAAGAYHGIHDFVDVSSGGAYARLATAHNESRGAPAVVESQVVIVPFNDLDGTLAALDGAREELAAVIMEPFLNSAGIVAAEPEYYRGVAEWCRANGAIFVADEVASFRTAYAGAADELGVEPDLICLGKAVGGGFAIGVVGGREDVMAVFDPRRPDALRHAGTFNGHPVTMAAGLAALAVLDRPAIARMNELGAAVVDGVRSIGERHGLELTATHVGSIGSLHPSAEPPTGVSGYGLDREPLRRLYWELLGRGYLFAPRGQFSISAMTTGEHVEGFLAAIEDCAPAVLRARA